MNAERREVRRKTFYIFSCLYHFYVYTDIFLLFDVKILISRDEC